MINKSIVIKKILLILTDVSIGINKKETDKNKCHMKYCFVRL